MSLVGRVVEAINYQVVSRVVHQPRLLRVVAGAVRRWPAITRVVPVVARRDSAVAVLRRQASFSSTAHAPNLAAGEFAIGMEAGTRHDADRKFLSSLLPSSARCGAVSAVESQRLIAELTDQTDASGRVTERSFDLVNEYLVRVAWRPLRRPLGPAVGSIASADVRALGDDKPGDEFVGDLRNLAAQLIAGSDATPRVRARVEASAARLNQCVNQEMPALQQKWRHTNSGDSASILRNAVGFLWVSQPVVVQAGALMMQELLGRRRVYDKLALRARSLGARAWTDPDFRGLLARHVLELLRFRPPFPILKRDVVRDTLFDVGTAFPVHAKGGSGLLVLNIGAMFDDSATRRSDAALYRPGRKFKDPHDAYMIFGKGERACIAQRHGVEILVSALVGLLMLPRLRWADPWYARIRYDGPAISSLRLRFS